MNGGNQVTYMSSFCFQQPKLFLKKLRVPTRRLIRRLSYNMGFDHPHYINSCAEDWCARLRPLSEISGLDRSRLLISINCGPSYTVYEVSKVKEPVREEKIRVLKSFLDQLEWRFPDFKICVRMEGIDLSTETLSPDA
jgi:hypothetical protein